MGGTPGFMSTHDGETEGHPADEGDQAATHTVPQVQAGVKVGHLGSIHSTSPVRLEEQLRRHLGWV